MEVIDKDSIRVEMLNDEDINNKTNPDIFEKQVQD